mmetsp:Transcript_115092/g.159655  ORF Transcript_115092/g.159655 Transcript_115092/m.159655 type:complete len:204 (+) Transcript_115092:458-1069(+)
MKGTGLMIKQKDMADLFMLTETFMRVNGKMTRRMAKDSTFILMVLCIEDLGIRINSMARDLNNGLMAHSLLVFIRMVRNMVRVSLPGQIKVHIMESSSTILLKELAPTSGMMEESLRVTGLLIRWMAKVYSRGQTDVVMKDSTQKMLSMAMVHSFGQMERDTQVTGKTVNSMAKVQLFTQMVDRKLAHGSKANAKMIRNKSNK